MASSCRRGVLLFMSCSVLLLMQSSIAQENSASSTFASVQGEGESDVTGESSRPTAFRRFKLACAHAAQSFEDLFQINDMEDVYTNFRRDYQSERTKFLYNKANTNHQGSLCQMSVTCCTPAMEKTVQMLSQNEFRFFYENIFRYHSELCKSPGKRLFKSTIQIMGDVVRSLEVRANRSLVGTLPIGIFADLSKFLISFSGTGDICPLSQVLKTQAELLIELKLKQLFQDDSDLGVMVQDSVTLQCMKNVSSMMVQNIFKELHESLHRQLHGFGLFVQATKLAREVLGMVRHHRFSESCITAITRMQYCSLCGAYGGFSPCRYMCINTLRGCFADLAELHVHFHHFTSFLRSLSASLQAELKPDVFISAHLSHLLAIVDYLHEREGALREQILTECGTDDYDTDASDEQTETRKRRSIFQPIQESTNSQRVDPILEQLNFKDMSTVLEVELTCLEKLEGKLLQVPEEICFLGDTKIAHSTNTKCWTGSNLGTYEHPEAGRLKKDQANNPVFSDLPMDTEIVYAALIHSMNTMTSAINATIIFKERCLQSDDEDCSNAPLQQCIERELDGSGSAMGSGSESGSGSVARTERNGFDDYEDPTFIVDQGTDGAIDPGLDNALHDEMAQNSTTTDTPITADTFTLGTITIDGKGDDEGSNNDGQDPTESIVYTFDNDIRRPKIPHATSQPQARTQESPTTTSTSATQKSPATSTMQELPTTTSTTSATGESPATTSTTSDGPDRWTSLDRGTTRTPAAEATTTSSGDTTEAKHPIIDNPVPMQDQDTDQADEGNKQLTFSGSTSFHTMQAMHTLLSLFLVTLTIIY